jgi:hypothetical protein
LTITIVPDFVTKWRAAEDEVHCDGEVALHDKERGSKEEDAGAGRRFSSGALSATQGQRPGDRPAIRRSYEGVLRQLEADLREYDELKAGKLKLPRLEQLEQIAPWITKIRIANRPITDGARASHRN